MKQFKTAHPAVINPESKLNWLPILVEVLERNVREYAHWHDYVQIWYCLEGEMIHRIGDTEHIQRPGSCFVILPYIDHTIDTSASKLPLKFLSLSFTDKFLIDRGYRFFSYFNKRANFEGRLLPMICELSGELRAQADALSAAMLKEFDKHKNMSFDALAGFLADFLRLLCRDDVDDRGFICIKDRANSITDSIRYMSENLGKNSRSTSRRDLTRLLWAIARALPSSIFSTMQEIFLTGQKNNENNNPDFSVRVIIL